VEIQIGRKPQTAKQRYKIHYNMSEYSTISKQTSKEEINKRDKDLKANAQERDQLQ